MTVFTEAAHAAEFILTEANGQRSRESATVVSGQDLAAGEVVMDNGSGKLTAWTAAENSDGSLVNEAIGVVIYAADASAADVDNVAYLARDAEVNKNLLTWPAETTSGGEEAHMKATLKLLGIIVRE